MTKVIVGMTMSMDDYVNDKGGSVAALYPEGLFDFEYPPGHFMRCNDWRLDLLTNVSAASPVEGERKDIAD